MVYLESTPNLTSWIQKLFMWGDQQGEGNYIGGDYLLDISAKDLQAREFFWLHAL